MKNGQGEDTHNGRMHTYWIRAVVYAQTQDREKRKGGKAVSEGRQASRVGLLLLSVSLVAPRWSCGVNGAALLGTEGQVRAWQCRPG